MRFGEKEITKEKFYAAKKPMKIWDVNVDNIVVYSFRIDDEKLLEKNKAIWTKIEDLKNNESDAMMIDI